MKFSYSSESGKQKIKGIQIPVYLKSKNKDRIISSYVQSFFGVLYIGAFAFFDNPYLKTFYAFNLVFLYFIISPRELAFNLNGSLKNFKDVQAFRGGEFLSLINSLINNSIFYRAEQFKNNPKWDLISFKLLFPMSAIFFLLSFISGTKFSTFDISIKSKEFYILAIVGSNYLASFTHLSAAKSAKYKMLFDIYNKMLEARATKTKKNEFQDSFEIWEVSLAIDILHFDMWAHKSYKEYFAFHLAVSIDYLNNEKAQNTLLQNKIEHKEILNIIKNIHDKKLTTYTASIVSLILDYRYQLQTHFYHNESEQAEFVNNVLPFDKEINSIKERIDNQDLFLRKYFKSVDMK